MFDWVVRLCRLLKYFQLKYFIKIKTKTVFNLRETTIYLPGFYQQIYLHCSDRLISMLLECRWLVVLVYSTSCIETIVTINGLPISYVRKIFRNTNIFYHLIRTHKWKLLETFACALNT